MAAKVISILSNNTTILKGEIKVIKKRFISIILALSVITTSFVSVVFADTSSDAEVNAETAETALAEEPAEVWEDAAKLLSILGIMVGKSEEDFGADDFLTRAEMCALAIRFMGMKEINDYTAKFSDVPQEHWANGYINAAASLGMVNGNGDGSFSPDDELTGAQAVKIIVSALGYELKAQDRGGYPAGYITVANELQLFKGAAFSDCLDTSVPRWKIAMLLFNALDAEVMEQQVYGDNGYAAVSENQTALMKYHNVQKFTGTVTAVPGSSLSTIELDEGEVIIDGKLYKTDVDATPFLGENVDFYCTMDKGDSKIIAMLLAPPLSDKTEINFDDIKSVTVTSELDVEVEYYPNDNSKSRKLVCDEPVIMYNGKSEAFDTAADMQAFLYAHMSQGTLTYAKQSADGADNILFVDNYDAYVVANVDTEHKKLTYRKYKVGGTDADIIDLSDDEVERKVMVYDENGAEIELSDLAANDVVMVYASTDTKIYKIYRSTRRVSGTIDMVSVVDGTRDEGAEWVPEEQPEPYWETVLDMDMSGMSCNDKGTWGFEATKEIDGRTYTVSTEQTPISGCGEWEMNPNSGIKKEDGVATAYLTRETWEHWHSCGAYGNSWLWGHPGSSEAGLLVSDIYSDDQVAVGDKIRVTARVKGYHIQDTADHQQQDSDETTANFRAFVRQSASPWYNGNGTEDSITLNETLSAGEWHDLTLEYTVTSENNAARTLKIDNKVGGTVYPLKLELANVKVERYVDPRVDNDPNKIPRPDISLDGTEYEITINGETYKQAKDFHSSLLTAGSVVTLFLDLNNRIVGYTKESNTSSYGLLMDVGVISDGFGSKLKVKILGTDNVLRTYETEEEVLAYDGSYVTKMPAEKLVTNQPADPMTDWHLWSTNNAENFQAIDRTYLTDSERSKAASRKIVWFRTNSRGEIAEILVPSMPEDHPDAKIRMVRNFGEMPDGTRNTMFQEWWPGWLVNGDFTTFADHIYHYDLEELVWFRAGLEDYDESSYAVDYSSVWNDNTISGRRWENAQLYRIPGSENIDFIVVNPYRIDMKQIGSSRARQAYVVDSISKTEDGYLLEAYRFGQEMKRIPLSSHTIKEGLRVMENIWVSSLDADSERLTADNIAYYEETKPWNVAYESDIMGNSSTPYFNENSFEKGDVVFLLEDSDGVNYIEAVLRQSIGIPSAYTADYATDPSQAYSGDATPLIYGEITGMDSENGTLTIEGYSWGMSDAPISGKLETQATSDISKFTIQWYATTNPARYEKERGVFGSATWRDYEIGDKMLIVGSADSIDYVTSALLFKD